MRFLPRFMLSQNHAATLRSNYTHPFHLDPFVGSREVSLTLFQVWVRSMRGSLSKEGNHLDVFPAFDSRHSLRNRRHVGAFDTRKLLKISSRTAFRSRRLRIRRQSNLRL